MGHSKFPNENCSAHLRHHMVGDYKAHFDWKFLVLQLVQRSSRIQDRDYKIVCASKNLLPGRRLDSIIVNQEHCLRHLCQTPKSYSYSDLTNLVSAKLL